MIDYQRVAKAIIYIKEHATEQPNLNDIAGSTRKTAIIGWEAAQVSE